jgi:hypothetical protein
MLRNIGWTIFWVVVGFWIIKHPAAVSAGVHNLSNFISTLGNS